MATNPGFEFTEAEKRYNQAQTDEERIIALEDMIRLMPQHKSAEALRKNLKTRYKKFKERIEKIKKAKKGSKSKVSIKKGEMQAVLFGFTNSGKSSLLKSLTNADPLIASYGFTTQFPEQGILNYEGCQIQIIDLPPVASENFDLGLVNTSDTILIVVEKLHEIADLKNLLKKARGKEIIVFNKIDQFNEETKRKIKETLKTKKYNFVMVSCKTDEGIDELKEKIFKSFGKIRIYCKQPNKREHDDEPMILFPESNVKEAAEKILHGFARNIKKARIWGPSSKFSGQEVGLKHVLKDRDVLEFTTK